MKKSTPNGIIKIIGIVLGAIWGILSIIPYSYISSMNSIGINMIYGVSGFPTYMAAWVGFRFYWLLIMSPLIGAAIGGIIGNFVEKYLSETI